MRNGSTTKRGESKSGAFNARVGRLGGTIWHKASELKGSFDPQVLACQSRRQVLDESPTRSQGSPMWPQLLRWTAMVPLGEDEG